MHYVRNLISCLLLKQGQYKYKLLLVGVILDPPLYYFRNDSTTPKILPFFFNQLCLTTESISINTSKLIMSENIEQVLLSPQEKRKARNQRYQAKGH